MNEEKDFTITTIDNPYNPFTHFDEWYAYDLQAGYNTLGYLARVCKSSVELSEEDQIRDINNAIEDILRINCNGMFAKIYEDQDPKTLKPMTA